MSLLIYFMNSRFFAKVHKILKYTYGRDFLYKPAEVIAFKAAAREESYKIM